MLNQKSIAGLQPNTTIWDEGRGSVAGFGIRRQTGPAAVYVLKYRTADGRQRWHTIGRHGSPWTPDMARAEARRILSKVVRGEDPAAQKQETRKAATVAELCDNYLADAAAGRILTRGKAKKPSTLATDTGRAERHIKPLLGRLKVAAVTRRDVERFRDAVAEGATAGRFKTGARGLARVTGGKGTATRTLALLGVIFTYAVRRGLRSDNPVSGVDIHAYERRSRRASDAEYAALGDALRTLGESVWPAAIAATKFLVLTGWRRGEALALRWSEIDLATRTARLTDTKTGASLRPLSLAACDVLQKLPRYGEYVFRAPGADQPMAGYRKYWLRIAERAELPADLTPHVLRHSFASVAVDLGFAELTIAALLGHRKASVTSRYAHHADAVLLAAADKVADRISELMGEARGSGKVVRLGRGR